MHECVCACVRACVFESLTQSQSFCRHHLFLVILFSSSPSNSNSDRFKGKLESGGYNLSKFPKLKPKMIEQMDHVLSVEIPTLMRRLPGIDAMKSVADVADAKGAANPFSAGSGVQAGQAWVVSGPQKSGYDNVFETLQRTGDKATGAACRGTMVNSGLGQADLSKIWQLSDIDGDGCLDREEFALCMFMMEETAGGKPLPGALPQAYVPPSKR